MHHISLNWTRLEWAGPSPQSDPVPQSGPVMEGDRYEP